jgi:hypothetical protein
MHVRRALALAGAVAAVAFTACHEPPFFPRWDSDMYMPLSTQPIVLDSVFKATGGIIPPATSAPDSFPPQQQAISGVLGDVLKNLVTDASRCSSTVNPALSCDMLKLTISKSKPIAAQDTLFVANSKANLSPPAAGTVVFPFTLASTDATKSDSISLTPQAVSMLQAAGKSNTPLWIMLRGRASNPTTSTITVNKDTLFITTSVTVRVATIHQ